MEVKKGCKFRIRELCNSGEIDRIVKYLIKY